MIILSGFGPPPTNVAQYGRILVERSVAFTSEKSNILLWIKTEAGIHTRKTLVVPLSKTKQWL